MFSKIAIYFHCGSEVTKCKPTFGLKLLDIIGINKHTLISWYDVPNDYLSYSVIEFKGTDFIMPYYIRFLLLAI